MRRLFRYMLALTLLAPYWTAVSYAHAATLTSGGDSLSNPYVASTSDHTISFALTDASPISVQQIDFQFATADNNSTKPSTLNLSNAELGSLSVNLSTGWSLVTTGQASGLLSIANTSPVSLGTSASLSVELQRITNQIDINTCLTNTGTLTDTCSVNITAYSDLGSTPVATGSVPYTVIQDPSMDFQVLPVSAGQTNNGITTDYGSTSGTVAFGSLSPDTVRYASQQLHIQTNAPHGYTVYAWVASTLSGQGNHTDISPFGATNATWTTPQSWMSPTGSHPGSNSGWIAANTTDTRVSGWSGSTSGKFGPLSASKQAVAHSSGPDSGTTVTLTFAFGVNIYQPSDAYIGNVEYEIDATY